ncbi:MAG: right-handed parallel beta-helix repeat-containing protein [Candidatus Bathyarchaeia archaeon]
MAVKVPDEEVAPVSYTVYKSGSLYVAKPSRRSGLKQICGLDGLSVLNAVVNALSAGGKVAIKGEILVNGTVSVTNAKITFEGASKSAKVVQTATNAPLFSVSADDVTFEGLSLVGKGDGNALDACVRLAGSAKRLTVRGCDLSNCTFGVYVEGHQSIIEGNHIHDLQGDTSVGVRVLGDGNRILGNVIVGGVDAINVQDSQNYADYNIIANNYCEGQSHSGIVVLYGKGNVVIGNNVKNCQDLGIDISWGADDTVVKGNTVHSVGSYCVDLDANYIVCSGNLLINDKADVNGVGIWVQGGKYCLISTNIIMGSGLKYGIVLSTPASAYNRVLFNYIGYCSSYAIYINNASCQYNVFYGNVFEGVGEFYYIKPAAQWNWILDNYDVALGGVMRVSRVIDIPVRVHDLVCPVGITNVQVVHIPAYSEVALISFSGYASGGSVRVELWDGSTVCYSRELSATPIELETGDSVFRPLWQSVLTWNTQKPLTVRIYNYSTASRTVTFTLTLRVICASLA